MATSTSTELDYRPSYLAARDRIARDLRALSRHAGALHRDVGHERIHRRRVHARPAAPAGQSVLRLIGRVFSILPIAHSASRCAINILAAICSAVAAGMWFLITERVLVSWFPERWQRIRGGVLAALIGATAFTVWNQSVVNEKVYTVSLSGIAIISWLMVRWSDDPDGPAADRLLVLVAYLLGLGYANHMAGILAAPAVGVAVLMRRPRTFVRWKLLLACVGALVLGMTPFATQPIRAAHFPAINEGEPTHARDCTFAFVQLQSRPVRQAGAARPPGAVRRCSSGCGGCTSSGSGCAT